MAGALLCSLQASAIGLLTTDTWIVALAGDVYEKSLAGRSFQSRITIEAVETIKA